MKLGPDISRRTVLGLLAGQIAAASSAKAANMARWGADAIKSGRIIVSPDGPIKTLADARDAARLQRRSGKRGPITIKVRTGTYYLPETLILGSEDSDTIWEAFHGEHPVISGGQIISGWTEGTDSVWTANAPAHYFRQLFVDGRRANRARIPTNGFFRIDGASSQDKPFQLRYRGNDIQKEWAARGDVEVVAYVAWSDLRMPIVNVDEATHTATLASDPQASNQEADARYFIENAPDALNWSGKWYLDRTTGKVSYIPWDDEDMEGTLIIASTLERLVFLQGSPETGELVRDVVFRGLTFAHAEWTMPATGYADTQSATPAPAAIEAVGAVDCTIEKCTVAHSGGYALFLGRGSKRNRVLANEFFDLGAGGIKVGEPALAANEADQNYGNIIADNNIHDLGLVYAAGAGIWVLQSGENQILHNHVHDLFSTAISVGWTWGYGPNQTKNNLIAFNHLHGIGKNMLSDLGGIYTNGEQSGTIIRNNLIHDVSCFNYGGWGIYPDEGSSDILIENNIVYNCQSAGFHQNYGRNNTIRNNIFAFSREYQLMRSSAGGDDKDLWPRNSFTMENNIVYFEQGSLLGNDWTDGGFVMRDNVYYDTQNPNIAFFGDSFSEWKSKGQDRESIIADPLFVNAGNFDFRLRPESPALKKGFRQIDISAVGPRVRSGANAW